MTEHLAPEDVVLRWRPISDERPGGGRYVIVCNQQTRAVGFARYRPTLSRWTFPSSAMAFEVTHFMTLPEALQ